MGNNRNATLRVSGGRSQGATSPSASASVLELPGRNILPTPAPKFLTIDTLLVPLSRWIFLEPLAATIFWLSFPIFAFPFIPFLFLGLCWGVAALCLVLYGIRKRASASTAPIEWSREIVVITGGSHGLGRELANSIADQFKPRKVIVLDIQPGHHESGLIAYYECDISDKRQLKSVSEYIVKDYGHPTILINNAGIVRGKSFLDLSDSDIEKTIGVNLMGPIFATRTFLPKMIEQNHGHIITVASVMGITGARNMTDYSASKFGVIGFSESLRQDLHKTNVNVSCIYPGLISTGMFHGVEHEFPRLTPPLDPAQVAKSIRNVITSRRNQDLKLPFYVNLSGVLRLLPIEFADWARNFTGANEDMSKFKMSLSASPVATVHSKDV